MEISSLSLSVRSTGDNLDLPWASEVGLSCGTGSGLSPGGWCQNSAVGPSVGVPRF